MGEDEDLVEVYLDGKLKFATARAKEDFQAWKQWKEAPEPDRRQALQTSINRFEPMVQTRLREWGTAPQINRSALHLELKGAVQKAHETWNPEKAQLGTWVDRNMRKALRHVNRYANLAYVPADRSQMMGAMQRTTDRLKEDLGRDPTDAEIGEAMGKPLRTVQKVKMDLSRSDIPASAFPDDPVSLYAQQYNPLAMDVLGLLDQQPDKPENDSFSPRTRTIYNYMRGVGGLPQVKSKGTIAKHLGVSPSTVTRGVKEIEGVIRKHT